ncbi:hypothetical protein GCM10011611_25330 [Aliidongia dinghuensis]|uniref:Peptidase S8/S53 domain-containing protein n=1 Tax=Aliidongia dinghuensis TaxID=1867774 RepID=A0A8J2YTC0_9PROT|nr:S8 family peptidase [Aliidongia dinghuensis]GGF18373.1 hypothetical protein GCM10011611_25330 [Aliidongia dinghuensis]
MTPTAEDLATTQLQLNNGLYAFQRGYFGANEEVAVYGTGVDLHPELAGRVDLGFDALAGTTGSTLDLDANGHDTAVAGVIAAARGNGGVEGVAPLSRITPVRIVDSTDTYNTSDAQLAAAIDWVRTQGIKISNNSWNAPGTSAQDVGATTFSANAPKTLAAYRRAIGAGGVEIWAAGNESKDQVDLFAGLPLLYPELQRGWVAVGSVDTSGVLSSFSNKCGAAAAWCLVAPGENVGLIYKTSGYATGSGTSFTTPQVAGAEALLLAAFPNLTPQTALQIILQTANKTGIYADTATYGQGLLDIERATRPVGAMTVATQGNVTYQATGTSVSLGSVFGMGLAHSTAQVPVVAQDAFQRGYATSLGSHVTAGVTNFDGVSRLGAFGRPDEVTWTDGSLRLSLIQSADPRLTAPGDAGGAKFTGTTTIAGVETRVGFGIDPGRLLESGRTPVSSALAGGMLAQGAVSNPYLALIDGAWSGGVATPFAGGTAVFAVANGRPLQRQGFDPQASDNGSTAAVVELAYRVGSSATLRGEAGVLEEQASILGATGTGAARVGNSRTEFAGLTGEVVLTPHLAAAGGLHAGLTDTAGRTGSLIQGTTAVTSFAAGLGLVETGALTPHGKWVLGASMPLRAASGEAQLVLPTAVDTSGAAVFSRVRAGLKADGREVDLQSAWSAPLTAQTALTGGLLWRQDPNNIRTAAAETVAAVRVDVQF